QISPGDVDDFAVERCSTLAGSVERLLKRRHGRVEGIRRVVIDLTRLPHSRLGKGAHALWNGSAETEETELARHFARLLGSSLGIGGRIHHRASGLDHRASGLDRSDFVGWQ